MNVESIRADVIRMLDEVYGSSAIPAPIDDQKIEEAYMMRKQDAAQIRTCCAKNKIIVSFRDAGEHTIERINKGNPCKGHSILDKSIKKGAEGKWTYDLPEETESSVLENCKGLVGSPLTKTDLKGKISVCKGGNGMFLLDELHCLNVMTIGKETTAHKGKIKAESGLSEEALRLCYTGDYDMHDLFVNGNRVIAGTVDEHSAIDLLNNSLFVKDATRGAKAKQFPGKLRKNTVTGKMESRTSASPYSLIRHGAQTSFMDYLLGAKGHSELVKNLYELNGLPLLPKEGTIVTISPKIVMFYADGKAYLLEGIGQVYAFYKKINPKQTMLNTIPFYYFFDELKRVSGGKYATEIAAFEAYINAILLQTINQ